LQRSWSKYNATATATAAGSKCKQYINWGGELLSAGSRVGGNHGSNWPSRGRI
jgi:hypothetical protein